MIKALKSFRDYGIPWRGHPGLHQELTWFATDDDRVLGVVLRDRVDNDFSWVLMAHVDLIGRDDYEPDYETSASGFRAVALTVSRPTQAVATKELHEAMVQIARGGKP
jgi:hypothetical protein